MSLLVLNGQIMSVRKIIGNIIELLIAVIIIHNVDTGANRGTFALDCL